eukprot:UN34013
MEWFEQEDDKKLTLIGPLTGFQIVCLVAFMCGLESLLISTNIATIYLVKVTVWASELPEAQLSYTLLDITLKTGTEIFFDGAEILGIPWVITLGVLPHLTVLALFLCYFYPMKHETRRMILGFLCLFTKWCLFPLILLGFLIAALSIEIKMEALNLTVHILSEYGAECSFVASAILILFVHFTAHIHESFFNETVGKLTYPKWTCSN